MNTYKNAVFAWWQNFYSTRNVNFTFLSYPIVRLSYPILCVSYLILSCVYPIKFSGYPIMKTFNQVCVYRVSCYAFIRFSVYRLSGFALIRFSVNRVNWNTSAFSRTNERNTQRSPTFCYYCRNIKYCWFLFGVTICFCFLKLKVYQYYYLLYS